MEAFYDISIGWRGRRLPGGAFSVGFSLVAPAVDSAGYDRIGYPFASSFGGAYDYVSAPLGRYQATDFTVSRKVGSNHIAIGKMDLTLDDTYPGRYNPKNPTSPLYGLIRPMRPVKLQATVDGVTYDLFHGWLVESEDDTDVPGGDGEARFQFQDFTIWLEREENITIASTGPISVGEAIGLIHDEIGWIDPLKRSFQEGDMLPDFSLDDKNALEAIADLLKVDLGHYYISREGVATYIDRYEPARRASLGTFEAAITAVPGTSLNSVKNRATSTKEGSTPQVFYDESSRQEFGFADHETVTSPYFNDDAHAASHAAYRVSQTKEPIASVWTFQVSEGPEGYLEAMVAGDMLDKPTINTIGMTNQAHYIMELTHRASAGRLQRTDWRLQEAPANQPAFVGQATVAPNDPAQWAGYRRIVY
jgi:hypothetical protein